VIWPAASPAGAESDHGNAKHIGRGNEVVLAVENTDLGGHAAIISGGLSGRPAVQLACRTRAATPRTWRHHRDMSARFFWFLPTSGDSRSIVSGSHASSHRAVPGGYRKPSRRYLLRSPVPPTGSATRAYLPRTGTWCEDAWLTTAALLAETEKLKFLVAFRPGLVPPTLAAQQTATLQRFSEGRVLLNVVSAATISSSAVSATGSVTTSATRVPASS